MKRKFMMQALTCKLTCKLIRATMAAWCFLLFFSQKNRLCGLIPQWLHREFGLNRCRADRLTSAASQSA